LGQGLAGADLVLAWHWPGTGPVLAWHWSALDRHEARAADLDGDFLRVGVRSLPVGDTLRVGGQDSGPRRRRMPPAARKRPRPEGHAPGRVECPPTAPDVQARRRAYPAGTDGVSRHYYSLWTCPQRCGHGR